MSRRNKKEFDEIKAGFDKEISKDIEKSKTPCTLLICILIYIR